MPELQLWVPRQQWRAVLPPVPPPHPAQRPRCALALHGPELPAAWQVSSSSARRSMDLRCLRACRQQRPSCREDPGKAGQCVGARRDQRRPPRCKAFASKTSAPQCRRPAALPAGTRSALLPSWRQRGRLALWPTLFPARWMRYCGTTVRGSTRRSRAACASSQTGR